MENKTTHFEIIPALLKELEMEATGTRRMLALVPDEQLGYKPHPKSMVMSNLASHLADLPSWVAGAFTTDGVDFAAMDFTPATINTNEDLLAIFDKSQQEGVEALQNAREEQLAEPWVMRNGEHIVAALTRYETIRHALAQTAHHRAQLGVYLRLLNIPIPGVYGPSADDMEMMAAREEPAIM